MMEDINSAATLISCLWNSTSGQASYICYDETLETLKNKMRQLRSQMNDMKREVGNVKNPREEVKEWISMVEEIEKKVGELIDHGSKEIEKNCVEGYCAKRWWSKYKIGKEIESKLIRVGDLRKDGIYYSQLMLNDRFLSSESIKGLDPRNRGP
uniref:Rx N-terminal domain-containing protein n=1 Tax=Manihot esculenta TaxID=3983 RepID=A0A2C9V7N6_MANES